MAFLGMRGTGDWATDQRPLNWREAILHRFPNGSAPLTAILSRLKSESVDDPQYHWWTKALPTQTAAVTGIFTNAGLSSAYSSGGTAGTVLYFSMSATAVTQYRVGHQVLLRDASDLNVDVMSKVIAKVVNGASSYIACRLLEDDDNSSNNDLSDCDVASIVGNINAEGAAMPDALGYDPTKWFNYTQIFRTPLEMTRTALRTRLRTGDHIKEAKREALELHSIEMEKALLWGIPTENIGDNGKPERTTLGLVPAIRGGYTGHGGADEAGTVDDYRTNTDYTGKTWLQGGEEWLDTQLEILFRYGSAEKMAFVGSGALLGIQRIVKNTGQYSYSAKTSDFGIQVVEWVTPFGMIKMKTHPLFSYDETTRNSMVVFEPENLKWRFITDTMYKKDDRLNKGQWTSTDGIKEEYLTEAGLEYHHPIGWGYLTGLNFDNNL